MDQQRKNILSAAAVFAVLLGVVVAYGSLEDNNHGNPDMGSLDVKKADNSTVKAVFTDENTSLGALSLEKADTPSERRKGLMGRESLENDTGMIFIWKNSENRSFWMKDTYVPLDMIFITAEKTIRTIKEAEPEPNVSDEELKIYSSEGPARYVIETNQNFTERKGIEEGHSVSFNLTG